MSGYGLDILANVLDSVSRYAPEVANSFDAAEEQKRKALLDAQTAQREGARSALLNQLTQAQIDKMNSDEKDDETTKAIAEKHNQALQAVLDKVQNAQNAKSLAESLNKIDLGGAQSSVPAGPSTSLSTGETTAGDNGFKPEAAMQEQYPELDKSRALSAGAGINAANKTVQLGQSALNKNRTDLFQQSGGLSLLGDKGAADAINKALFEQDKEDQIAAQKAAELKAKYGENGVADEPFEPGSSDYQIADYIATHNVPTSQWKALWSGLGKVTAAKPKILATVMNIAAQKGLKYDWLGNEMDFKGGMSHAGKAGTLTPDIMDKEAQLSGMRTAANNSPEIAGLKANVASSSKSAVNNQVKIDNANAANTLFNKVMGDNGQIDPQKIHSLSPVNVGELFMSTAKLLNTQGQLSDQQLNEVSQPTLAGSVAKLTQYFGHQFGGATTMDVLENMHDLIQREGRQAQRAKNAATSGSALNFEGSAPPAAKATMTDDDIINKYRKKK